MIIYIVQNFDRFFDKNFNVFLKEIKIKIENWASFCCSAYNSE